MIHPCCDNRCWKRNEPALFHTHQCLQKDHSINYEKTKVQVHQKHSRKPGTGTMKRRTHPHTCCREAPSRVCSRGICSPLAPHTSYMSSSMLRGMKERKMVSQFFMTSNLKIMFAESAGNKRLYLRHLHRLLRCH